MNDETNAARQMIRKIRVSRSKAVLGTVFGGSFVTFLNLTRRDPHHMDGVAEASAGRLSPLGPRGIVDAPIRNDIPVLIFDVEPDTPPTKTGVACSGSDRDQLRILDPIKVTRNRDECGLRLGFLSCVKVKDGELHPGIPAFR
jgi:hypothetical protein